MMEPTTDSTRSFDSILRTLGVMRLEDFEDDRRGAGVVSDPPKLPYDERTITGARPTLYKEILAELDSIKYSQLWNEVEWQDYSYEQRTSTQSSSLESEDSIDDMDDACSVTSGSTVPPTNNPSTTVSASSGVDDDPFMNLYKGYQKYAYY